MRFIQYVTASDTFLSEKEYVDLAMQIVLAASYFIKGGLESYFAVNIYNLYRKSVFPFESLKLNLIDCFIIGLFCS